MSKVEKLMLKILNGAHDQSISFSELCNLLTKLGFDLRIKGSHHIFTMGGVEEILNIQAKGSKAKPYQVKQIRQVFLKYKMGARFE